MVDKLDNSSLDAIIAQRVSEELSALKNVEREIMQTELDIPPKETDIDSLILRKQVEELKSRTKREDKVTDEGIEKARSGLIECLRRDPERSLDCRGELHAFKRSLQRSQATFIEKYT